MSPSGLRVARSRGEDARRALLETGSLDTSLEIAREEGVLILPLVEGAPVPRDLGEVVSRPFVPVRRPGPADYRELVKLPDELRPLLPRSFDVVGDIVLVRVPKPLEEHRLEIGAALLAFVPGARLVGADRGVHGVERRRTVERIAGTGPWRTRHRENGLEFDVDVERAYFSPRLAREHERVASEVQSGDRVYDLCSGIGPFALTIARDGRARSVTAVDANPEAIALLRATLARYPFARRVEAVEARLEEFLPTAGPRERVVLNLPREGIKYIASVARAVAPGGRLYYYEVTDRERREESTKAMMDALGSEDRFTVVEEHVVHAYSPTSDLRAFVLERGGR